MISTPKVATDRDKDALNTCIVHVICRKIVECSTKYVFLLFENYTMNCAHLEHCTVLCNQFSHANHEMPTITGRKLHAVRVKHMHSKSIYLKRKEEVKYGDERVSSKIKYDIN